MSALTALVVAVEVASRKRDDARKVLQDALAAQQAARSQLDQLEDYARETQTRWGMKADTAMKPEVMFHHYHRIAKVAQFLQHPDEPFGIP